MKKLASLIILIILLSTQIYSQETQINSTPASTKNTIYTYGGTLLLVSSYGLAYERKIIDRPEKLFNTFLLKGRASYFGGWVSQNSYYDLSFVGLTGVDKYHFEANLGLGMAFSWKNVLPSVSVGFRRQKPSGGLVFRTGVGYPEFIYLSFGAAF